MGILDTLKSASLTPTNSELSSIRAKKENVDDYMKSVAKTPDAPKADPVTSDKDKLHPNAKYGDNPGEKRIDVSDMTKPLVQSYKKGTDYVPKTGLALLHKGEKVVPVKENNMDSTYDMVKGMGKDKAPKKEIEHMRIRKAKSGGHVVEHHHHSSAHPKEEHVMADMKALHDHLDQHMDDSGQEPGSGQGSDQAAQMTAAPSPAPAPMAAPGA
jgi:hypothetical protein